MEHRGGEDIDILHSLIFFRIDEALPLDTCHIQDVDGLDDFGREFLGLDEGDPMLTAEVFAFLGHTKLWRRDENEAGTEMRHPDDQRVHCTSILEISYQGDRLVIE